MSFNRERKGKKKSHFYRVASYWEMKGEGLAVIREKGLALSFRKRIERNASVRYAGFSGEEKIMERKKKKEQICALFRDRRWTTSLEALKEKKVTTTSSDERKKKGAQLEDLSSR